MLNLDHVSFARVLLRFTCVLLAFYCRFTLLYRFSVSIDQLKSLVSRSIQGLSLKAIRGEFRSLKLITPH